MTPTQRTMKALRDRGLKCDIVERWVPKARVRRDLFHIIDIIALDLTNSRIIGVQSTGQDFAEHHKKLTVEKRQNAINWLNAGGRLELYGWRKVKVKRGSKAMVWRPRVKVYSLEDFGVFKCLEI